MIMCVRTVMSRPSRQGGRGRTHASKALDQHPERTSDLSSGHLCKQRAVGTEGGALPTRGQDANRDNARAPVDSEARCTQFEAEFSPLCARQPARPGVLPAQLRPGASKSMQHPHSGLETGASALRVVVSGRAYVSI